MNPSVFVFSSALVFLSDLLSVNGRPFDSSSLVVAVQATPEPRTTFPSLRWQEIELGEDIVVEEDSAEDFFPQGANFDSLNEISQDTKPFKPIKEEEPVYVTATSTEATLTFVVDQSNNQQFAQLGSVEVVTDLPVFDRNILLELRKKNALRRNL